MKKLPHPLSHRLRTRVATATALLAALAATPAAQASLVFSIVETGGNVVITGSGSIDTSDLFYRNSDSSLPVVEAAAAYVAVGLIRTADAWIATNFSGPGGFGAGTLELNFARSSTGDTFGFIGAVSDVVGIPGVTPVILPQGYASGSDLSGTATFSNASFASLGMDPGTYVYTFGSGEHADSITVQIGPTQAAVPEPASIALAGLGLAGLAATRRRKQG